MRALPGVIALALFSACASDPEEWEEAEGDQAWEEGKTDDATGPLRVVEVLPRASAEREYVELVNTSDAAVDLAGWYLSFGSRRVKLAAFEERASTVAPGGIVLVVDADADLSGIPASIPAVIPSRDLGGLFETSRRLVVRNTAMVVSDRADASRPTLVSGISLERTSAGWVASPRGATPGARNAAGDTGMLRTYFANPPVDEHDPIAPQLVALIDDARVSLDAAFYQVDHPELIDAFIRAQQRGVNVRFVTDTQYFTHQAYVAGYQRMIDAGIPIVPDGRTARMHNKFLVIDGEAVFTGSYNLLADTGPSFQHLDNAVLLRSRAAATAHTIEFEEMFGGKFGPNKTDNTQHEVWVDGARVEIYFAPTDKPKTAILRELARASDNIYFVAFSFYQKEIADTMVARFQAGVDVRGVTDDTGGGVDSQIPKLITAGIDARRPTIDIWVHHKFIIVNYGSDDPVVITGSYNFSDKADKTNDEAIYVIHDRRVADEYYRIYRSVYDASSGPNADTTGLATLTVTEVLTSSASSSPFIELANHGDATVDLAGLTITDRDGAPIDLAPLVTGSRTLAPGARAVVRPLFRVEADDPLLILDADRRVVATFDAPAFAGSGKSLVRDDMTAPDAEATYSAATPTPGQ